jgi:hypothetical protein
MVYGLTEIEVGAWIEPRGSGPSADNGLEARHSGGPSTTTLTRAEARLRETMIDEGIYLFFDNEISAGGKCCFPFEVIVRSDKYAQFDKIAQCFKMSFSELERAAREEGEDRSELSPLTRRRFAECYRKTKTILFVPIKSFLELALGLSADLVDVLRETMFRNRLLFGVETFDGSCFWTGSSIRRWFNDRFPREPKKIRYARPPSVLDLLYEFLEETPYSYDTRIALR